jgi:serine/threonine-protein phosphatase CPPED1
VEVAVKVRHALLLAFFVICVIPGSGQEKPFYFAMLTDTQFGMYENNRSFTRETANCEFAVATVNRLKPGFVIVLGDLVNKEGDADQIREFQRVTQKIDPAIPAYYVAGNHDVGHEPTPETVAAYRKIFGRDYYSFRAGPIYGIVLDSTLIQAPTKDESEYQEQLSWLNAELEKAKGSGAQHIIVFQHHPFFIADAQEPELAGRNIASKRRQVFLGLLHRYSVRYVFAGHMHASSVGKDGDLEMTVTGPVSMPFGEDGSGMRLAEVTAAGVRHRYYDFGKMPDGLAIK